MGFKEGNFPPVDPAVFLNSPLQTRMRTLAQHWGEYGFGTARNINVIYIFKIVVLYALAGVALATIGVSAFWEVSIWWNDPIVYQRLVVWTVLLEAMNLAGSWGPLAGKFKPMMGGFLFYSKVGTIRMRPFSWVPGTAGHYRTGLDVALYYAFLASLAVAIVLPGVPNAEVSAWMTETWGKPGHGLVSAIPLAAALAFWLLLGLRDKIFFLAARAEQYLPLFLFFAVLPTLGTFADMIIAGKLAIVTSWVGAAVGKFGRHFTLVIPPMISNTPFWAPKWLKRSMYRSFPNDMRPSKAASLTAHVLGTIVEIAAPLTLLFSTNSVATWAAAILMACFCFFIISTFPLAVPLEWNVLFGYLAFALFIGFPAQQGFSVGDFSNPMLLIAVLAILLFFPILGNLRPDKVSFLPSLRQYSGNWATALFSFTPGAEAKLNAITRPTMNQVDQLQGMGIPYVAAEITLQQTIAWRSTQSQGKGLFSILYTYLPDVESRTIREGEFLCNSLTGFNFGDAHMHGYQILPALQEKCHFEPGELIVAFVESQPIHKGTQAWKLVDAATGVLAEGTWNVAEMVDQQPWLENGPISLPETYHRPDAEWPAFDLERKPEFWQATDPAVARVVGQAEEAIDQAAAAPAFTSAREAGER